MLHILYGPDSFSRAEALAALRAGLDSDGMLATNTTALEAKSLTLAHLAMVSGAAPFLAANRLVTVTGLLTRLGGQSGGRRRAAAAKGAAAVKLPEEWTELPDAIASLPPTTTLVLLDGDLPAQSPLLAALGEHGRTRNFPKLPAKALEGWIAQRAARIGLTLEPAALRLFAASASPDTDDDGQWHALWGLSNDLEKVSLYAGHHTVTAEDLARLTPTAADTNVFAFVDAVVERRGDEALRRLSGLIAAGQPPPVLLTMLTRGYRQLVLWADLAAAGERPEEIGRRLNIPAWRLREARAQAARYTPARLAAIYDRILTADRSVKRGESDETLALELLTADLAAVR